MEPQLPQSSPLQSPATNGGFSELAPKVPNKFSPVIAAIVVVLLGTGSAFAYFRYSGQQLSPEEVLKNMIANSQSIKTSSFSGDLGVALHAEKNGASFGYDIATNGATTTFQLAFSGKIDISNFSNTKQSWNIRAAMSTGTVPVASGGIEFISLGKVLYLKLNAIDFTRATGGKPNPVAAILSVFTNQWFKLDTEAIAKTFLEAGDIAARLKDQKLQQPNQVSPEKIQKLRDLAAQHIFFKATQTLAGETLDGQSTYHYKLSLDKDAVMSFLVAAVPVLSDKPFPEGWQKDMRAALDSVRFENLELWIGKKDFHVRKLAVSVSIVTQSGSGRFTLNENLSDINQSVTIAAPEGAKDANEILGGFLGGMMGPATSTGSMRLNTAPGTVKPL